MTAQLAYSLNQPFFWDVGMLQFLKGRELLKSGVYSVQPYSPGRIPVVFVHGTFSSPVWWAEMFNTLRSDPVLSGEIPVLVLPVRQRQADRFFPCREFRESLSQMVERT